MNIMNGLGLNQWLRRFAVDDFERRLDERIEDSFPASDPPSFSRRSPSHGRARIRIGKRIDRNRNDDNALH